jgi:CheY-like chemotaxis protein
VPDPRCRHARREWNRPSAPIEQQEKNILIVFITASRNEAVRSRVLALGTTKCLYKPFSDTAMLAALNSALQLP